MLEGGRKHPALSGDARRFGARLGEWIAARHASDIDDLGNILGDAMRVIEEEVRKMKDGGLPSELAHHWGHECINGLQDYVLEQMDDLELGAALVGIDPARVTR
jgi:hypothetical protein